MSINRALTFALILLSLLVVVTVINFNNHKDIGSEYDISKDELLMINICIIPEIIRSYEKVRNIYSIRNTFFFRYIQNTCNTCLDIQLNEILTLQEEIGKDYIWIFPAYLEDRNSRIQLSAELAKFNYRNFPADSLFIPTFNGEQRSYYAWINGDGEIGMVFIPDRNNVHNTRQYFLEVKNMLKTLSGN